MSLLIARPLGLVADVSFCLAVGVGLVALLFGLSFAVLVDLGAVFRREALNAEL